VALPALTVVALKTVLSGEPFRARELPGLDAEEQLTLARRLLREGVIVGA
jgi:bifunctional lysine-specific demethylase and histidyl-hydroxylase NO66